MKTHFCTVTLLLLFSNLSIAQNVGIGTSTPHASAQLEVESSTKGLLIPRVTTAQMNAIASPAKGLMVLDTTSNQLMVNMGSSISPNWQSVVTGSGWRLTGNSGTNPASNFIGTTDKTALIMRMNNNRAGLIDTSANIGLGVNAALQLTSGSGNTALGNGALFRDTSGWSNTSIGASSMLYNTSGTYNTSLGFSSMDSNRTGGYNTAIGALSNVSADGLDHATAVGAGATSGCNDCIVLGRANTTVGIALDSPIHAGLETSTTVGAAAAIFGAGKYGVAIEANNPEIGFNYYYNNATRTIKAGYSSALGMDPGSGDVYLINFGDSVSTSDFGTIAGGNALYRLYIQRNGNIGIGTTSPTAKLHVYDGSVAFSANSFASGTPGNPPLTGGGKRMMWYNDKAAFRAGAVLGNQWDKDSVGNYSIAAGFNSIAKSDGSVALGWQVTAQGAYSVALGYNSVAGQCCGGIQSSVAIGRYDTAFVHSAFAIGIGSKAYYPNSYAIGNNTRSSSNYTFSIGNNNFTFRDSAFAIGNNNSAEGTGSLAMGTNSFTAVGSDYSTAIGNNNNITGKMALALGNSNTCNALNSMSLGNGNTCNGTNSTALGNGNTCGGTNSTILGSDNSTVQDYATAIGKGNTVNGPYNLAMGTSNTTGGAYSVSIGYGNNSTSTTFIPAYSFGSFNAASGNFAMAVGTNCNANGAYSTAMGYNASSGGQNYSFCISGNSSGVSPTNTASNQMMMDFPGGYYFWTGSSGQGVHLDPNGNSWLSNSDSRKKENFLPMDGEKVLEAIREINFTSWNYKGGNARRERHYGIMAQDFFNAFGHDPLGVIGNDTTVNPIDMIGVAFSAIQALEKRTEEMNELHEENDKLKAENEAMKARIDVLAGKLEQLINDSKRKSYLANSK